MAARSSAKSELRVNSADFEVGENDQIISENNGHSFLELRALRELKYSCEIQGNSSYQHCKHIRAFFVYIGLTFILFVILDD